MKEPFVQRSDVPTGCQLPVRVCFTAACGIPWVGWPLFGAYAPKNPPLLLHVMCAVASAASSGGSSTRMSQADRSRGGRRPFPASLPRLVVESYINH